MWATFVDRSHRDSSGLEISFGTCLKLTQSVWDLQTCWLQSKLRKSDFAILFVLSEVLTKHSKFRTNPSLFYSESLKVQLCSIENHCFWTTRSACHNPMIHCPRPPQDTVTWHSDVSLTAYNPHPHVDARSWRRCLLHSWITLRDPRPEEVKTVLHHWISGCISFSYQVLKKFSTITINLAFMIIKSLDIQFSFIDPLSCICKMYSHW